MNNKGPASAFSAFSAYWFSAHKEGANPPKQGGAMFINAYQPAYAQTTVNLTNNVLRELSSPSLANRLNRPARDRLAQQPVVSQPAVVKVGQYRPLPGQRLARNLSVVVSKAAGLNPLGYPRMPPLKGEAGLGRAWNKRFPYQFSINGVSHRQSTPAVRALGGSLELRISRAGRGAVTVPAQEANEPIKIYADGLGAIAYPPALAAQMTMADIRGRLRAGLRLDFGQGAPQIAAAYGYPVAAVKGGRLNVTG